MITQDQVEKAIQWIMDNADAASQARADKLYLEDFGKSLKAELMLECEALSAVEKKKTTLGYQEMYALDHDKYRAHLKGLHEAIRLDTKYTWLKSAAEDRLDIWRTQESTKRVLKV